MARTLGFLIGNLAQETVNICVLARRGGSHQGGRFHGIDAGMQAIDMPAADQRANHVATAIIGVPVGELIARHVEVDRVSDF